MMDHPMDLLRLLNSIIASVAFLLLAVRINDDWRRMTRGWKVSRLGILGLLLVYAYGSVELMLVDPPVPLGLRVYLALTALTVVLVGLIMVRNEDQNEGWIRASVVQDILDEVEAAHSRGCNPPAPGCLIARERMREAIKDARKSIAR